VTAAPRPLAFAVVDVETTGLDAATDRIVEVAVVRLAADGRVTHEYATTIDPGRSVLLSEVHGLTDELVRGAPRFEQAAAALAARLTGAVLVGHHVAFDVTFLQAEYDRAGIPMPPFPALCTRTLAERLGRRPEGWNLAACCAEAGVPAWAAHTALGDARAAGRLFAVYLAQSRARGWSTLEALGCDPPVASPRSWRTGAAFLARQRRRVRVPSAPAPGGSGLLAPAAGLVRRAQPADALQEGLDDLR
jgi:DNA polymerase III epsilon subunit-like protein